MTAYINRVIDVELAGQLDASGAVLVVGPKWCGKTTTASRQAKSVIKLQDVKFRAAYLQMADTDPAKLLDGDTPRLIDEWQEAPILWDAVRNAVDERGEDGLPMDCSLPGSSAHGIFQARVVEWGAIAFSRIIASSVQRTRRSSSMIQINKK